MKKTGIIEQLLKLGDDWEVVDIVINENFKEVNLYLRYKKAFAPYPGSEEEYRIYDYTPERQIRHLDIFEYKVFLNVRIPRVKNNKSEIGTIELGWAGQRVSYTYLFEGRVIETLQMSKNQTKTADYLETTFDIVHGIMKRAVARGLSRRGLDGTLALGINEKSYGNGQKYLTVLSDPVTKSVLDVIDGRKTDDAQELLSWTLSPAQLDQILIVSMDMWKPYMNAVDEIVPQADIVHDKFHVAKYLNKAVDDVRKKEVKQQDMLKGSKYVFLKNEENRSDAQNWKFEQIDQINLKTSQAWKIKENFKGIYTLGKKQLCLHYFKDWYINALESDIGPMVKVAGTMLRHLKGIVNSAVTDITNSITEGINSQIQVVKTVARGFANVEGYRNAILFFQGKLKMFPL
jgi:transposase